MQRIIAIDHGNRMVKTLNHSFTSGYVESSHLPTMGGDVLVYKGKEYTLSDKRIAQMNDKTENDSFFILSLFAIGKELLESPEAGIKPQRGEVVTVELLIGLPPLHYKSMCKKFEQYFTAREYHIEFELNKQPLVIKITGAQAFPQAYSATLTVYDQINDSQIVSIVDIGGYTVDCLQLVNLRPNMEACTSLYMGVNTLFRKINEQVRATGAQDIRDSIIESIILGDRRVVNEYSQSRIDLIRESAQKFVLGVLAEIAQTGLDLAEDKTVFVGGGSILLKDHIIKTGKVKKPVFVNDVFANVKGYQMMYNTQKAVKG